MNSILTNLMNFKNNSHASFAIYGAALIEVLKIWLPHYETQLSGTQKVLTWYGILAASTTGNVPPPSNPDTMKTKSILPLVVLFALIPFLFTGCVSAIKAVGDSKAIVSVTETTLGLRLAEATQNQTPEFDFGYHRTTVVLEPASTNGPIYAPNYANTFSFDQNSTLSFALDESVASGIYQTASPNGTNRISSQPIVPK